MSFREMICATWYYFKNVVANSRIHKIVAGSILAVIWQMSWIEILLPVQIIIVWWMIMMVIWTIAWSIKEWFSFHKFWMWIFKLLWYYLLLFFGMALDRVFETTAICNLFYWFVVFDLLRSFFKHAPVLGIWVNKDAYDFIAKLESRISNYFLKKIWLDEVLDDNQNNNGRSSNMTSDVRDNTDREIV